MIDKSYRRSTELSRKMTIFDEFKEKIQSFSGFHNV